MIAMVLLPNLIGGGGDDGQAAGAAAGGQKKWVIKLWRINT